MTRNPALPRAAQKALDRAKKQAAALAPGDDPANTVNEGEGETPKPVDQRPAQVGIPDEPAAQEAAAPQIPDAPQAKPQRIDPEDYKERYRTLKAYHDKEATRFHQAEKAFAEESQALKTKATNLATQNAALVKEVADLKVQLEQGADSGQGKTSPEFDFSDDELAVLGDEGASMVASIVDRMVAARTQADAKTQPEPAPTAAPVEVDKTRFFRGLGALVPNWEELQAKPGFAAFMNQANEATGVTRQTELESCFQIDDYVTAASFYQDFMSANRASEKTPKRDELVMPGGQRPSDLSEGDAPFDPVAFTQVKRQIAMLNTNIGSGRQKPGDAKKLKDLLVREEQLSRAYRQLNQR